VGALLAFPLFAQQKDETAKPATETAAAIGDPEGSRKCSAVDEERLGDSRSAADDSLSGTAGGDQFRQGYASTGESWYRASKLTADTAISILIRAESFQ
jgi:hypothetical protein